MPAGKAATLTELGDELHVTRERVRQVESTIRKTLATRESRQQIFQHDPCERCSLGIGEYRAQALFRVGKGFDRNDDPHGLRPSPAQRQIEGISRFN